MNNRLKRLFFSLLWVQYLICGIFLAAAAKNAERMRKRKSRWAPEGEKVAIPPPGLPIPVIPKGDFLNCVKGVVVIK
jgi:hypothetical protein